MNQIKYPVSDSKKVIDTARYHIPKRVINLLYEWENLDFYSLFFNGYCLATEEITDLFHTQQQDDNVVLKSTNSDWEEIKYPLFSWSNLRILKLTDFNYTFISSVNMSNLLEWLYFRMGLSLQMLDKTIQHLKSRYVGNQEQIKLQLIKADIASFLTEYTSIVIDIDNNCLEPSHLANLHKRLTLSNNYLTKLCGAHGYVSGGTMYLYYVSRIIEVIYGSKEALLHEFKS